MLICACSACWPDAHLKPKSLWTGIWNLEIPSYVKQSVLIQKDPTHKVIIRTLRAGSNAQVLYVGPYAGKASTIKKLHAYSKTQGYTISVAHEEVYLTKPGPKAKTVIRYVVKKNPAIS